MKCLRCDKEMTHIGTNKIQMGETGWLLGDLPNLLAGAMEVDIYICSVCGEIKFFRPQGSDDGIAKTVCPSCGQKHDIDYPKCPFCKYDYINQKQY